MIYLIEDEKQVLALKNSGLDFSNDTLISFTGHATHYLKIHGFKFQESPDFYDPSGIWNYYPDTVDRMELFVKSCDKLLFDLSPEFKSENIEYFSYHFYAIKRLSDQLDLYTRIIKDIFSKFKNETFCYFNGGEILIDERFQVNQDAPLLNLVLPEILGALGAKTERFNQNLNYEFKEEVHHPDSLKRKIFRLLFPVKVRLQNFLCKFKPGRIKLLSFNCFDIIALLENDDRFNVFQEGDSSKLETQPIIGSRFLKEFETKNFNFQCYGISIEKLLKPMVIALANNMDTFLKGYLNTRLNVKIENYDAVFVNTLSYLNFKALYIHKLCMDKKVPIYCWMHGGHGGYYSLPGFDVHDYRFTNKQIVYGPVLKQTAKSPNSVLKKIGSAFKEYDVLSLGMPLFERRFKDYKRPTSKKKKVGLVIGCIEHKNNWGYGKNRPYYEFNNYHQHTAILETLSKYSDRYDVSVKDYPSKLKTPEFWEVHKGVTIYTDEITLEKYLQSMDLVIFSWISTAFTLSLSTDADVFLLDTEPFAEEVIDCVEKCIFLESETPKFIDRLEAYLEKGEFYTRDKSDLRKVFVEPEDSVEALVQSIKHHSRRELPIRNKTYQLPEAVLD